MTHLSPVSVAADAKALVDCCGSSTCSSPKAQVSLASLVVMCLSQKELKVLCLNNYWLKFSDCAVYTTVGLQHILLRISHDLTQNIYA
jgi:hypothetical protein